VDSGRGRLTPELRRPELLVVSHTVVRRSGDTWLTFNRVGEIVCRLAAMGWSVTLVVKEGDSEFATFPLPSSVQVYPLRVPWSRHISFVPWLRTAVAFRRARHALVFMPSLLAALSTLPLARRAVMYAGGSWGLRDDFPPWRGRLETLAARRVSHVIVAGEALRAHFLPYARSLELCVPHVHEDVAARLRDRRPTGARANEPPRVLYVGGFNVLKGIRELLHAARTLPGIEFRLVGQVEDDELAAEIAAASEALPNLSFGRYREWDSLREEYAWANILALPSYTEGFPRILYEAAAYGLALVTTPVGGIPARLSDGRDALFVEVGSGDSLVRALERLAADPQLTAELAVAARTTLGTSFQDGDAADQLDRALRERRRAPAAAREPALRVARWR
jgi:glycosyltransferase involved in cell wall biosynthesis